jgi:hypothetical protein
VSILALLLWLWFFVVINHTTGGGLFISKKKPRRMAGYQKGRAASPGKHRAHPKGDFIMAEITEVCKRAIVRMDIVQSYWMRRMEADMFVKLYNADDISWQLLEESGPIEAEELNRWAGICMEVGK